VCALQTEEVPIEEELVTEELVVEVSPDVFLIFSSEVKT